MSSDAPEDQAALGVIVSISVAVAIAEWRALCADEPPPSRAEAPRMKLSSRLPYCLTVVWSWAATSVPAQRPRRGVSMIYVAVDDADAA